MEGFTSFDIIKMLHITRGALHQYIDRGLIRPSLETAAGQGTKNIFSHEDLYRIEFFRRLHETGWDQRSASSISRDPKLDFNKVGEGGIKYHITTYRILVDLDASRIFEEDIGKIVDPVGSMGTTRVQGVYGAKEPEPGESPWGDFFASLVGKHPSVIKRAGWLSKHVPLEELEKHGCSHFTIINLVSIKSHIDIKVEV